MSTTGPAREKTCLKYFHGGEVLVMALLLCAGKCFC